MSNKQDIKTESKARSNSNDAQDINLLKQLKGAEPPRQQKPVMVSRET